jgi:hypothetical protein
MDSFVKCVNSLGEPCTEAKLEVGTQCFMHHGVKLWNHGGLWA